MFVASQFDNMSQHHLHSLCWTAIVMGKCEFHSSARGRDHGIVEWHSAAATLFILMENREEIYLEIDNEIFNVKVQCSTNLLTMY